MPKQFPTPILKQLFKTQKVKRREVKAKKKLIIKLERKAIMVRVKMSDEVSENAEEPLTPAG